MTFDQSAGSDRQPMMRWRDGAIATLLIIVAAVVLYALTKTDLVHYSQQHDLFYIACGLIALSIPGPIIRLWDIPGQIFLWNGAGWCLGLAILGMASIGAAPLLPLVLLAAALTFWPHPENDATPWLGAMIALSGGFLTCWILWGSVYPDIPFTTV